MTGCRGWLALVLLAGAVGCGGGPQEAGERRSGPERGGPPGERGEATAAVPVEVAVVGRRDVSAYIETNGTLEAENEVDLVARVSAPIVELLAEEGLAVRRGQTLARLDDAELRARLEIDRVALAEATQAHERARKGHADNLISTETYALAQGAYESAVAQLDSTEIQLGYTNVTAPFDGLVVARYVQHSQQVSPNTPLYRISDFDPLLCPIQVPERELPRLGIGQPAHLTVESWPDRRFAARVLRIRPVVDPATGTIKVTLAVEGGGLLRPGMFARVFVETETRRDVPVIPRAALALDSVGDTVYVARDGVAARREVTLGFREGDWVEVTAGLAEGESVVVVGHDGLSDGTPIQLLAGGAALDAGPEQTAPSDPARVHADAR